MHYLIFVRMSEISQQMKCMIWILPTIVRGFYNFVMNAVITTAIVNITNLRYYQFLFIYFWNKMRPSLFFLLRPQIMQFISTCKSWYGVILEGNVLHIILWNKNVLLQILSIKILKPLSRSQIQIKLFWKISLSCKRY